MAEQNPLMTGTAAVALAAAHIAKQIEWGQITLAQGKEIVQQGLGIIAPHQGTEIESIYRAVAPGLF